MTRGDDCGRRWAAYLHALVREHPEFEVLDAPISSTYALRYLPNAWAGRQPDADVAARADLLNERLARELVGAAGKIPVSLQRVRFRVALTLELGATGLEQSDLDDLFAAVARTGRQLARQLGQEVTC